MARSSRGLPDNFALDLTDEKPTVIGDFLDEEPAPLPIKRAPKPQAEVRQEEKPPELRVAVTREPVAPLRPVPAPVPVPKQQPAFIRYQLNCTPKSKDMLEELVKYIRTLRPMVVWNTTSVPKRFFSIW